MFEKCDWTIYLINTPKHHYQSNNTCAVIFILIFSLHRVIYIPIVTRLFYKRLNELKEEVKAEAYLEPKWASMMELFVKVVNSYSLKLFWNIEIFKMNPRCWLAQRVAFLVWICFRNILNFNNFFLLYNS